MLPYSLRGTSVLVEFEWLKTYLGGQNFTQDEQDSFIYDPFSIDDDRKLTLDFTLHEQT